MEKQMKCYHKGIDKQSLKLQYYCENVCHMKMYALQKLLCEKQIYFKCIFCVWIWNKRSLIEGNVNKGWFYEAVHDNRIVIESIDS